MMILLTIRNILKTGGANAFKWLFTAMIIIAGSLISLRALARPGEPAVMQPAMVNKFYNTNLQQPFWYSVNPMSAIIRHQFIAAIDSAHLWGLERSKYHYRELRDEPNIKDSAEVLEADRTLTDAFLAFSKDIYLGAGITSWLSNDEISGKYANADNDFLVGKILAIRTAADVDGFLKSLEPNDKDYGMLKQELKAQTADGNRARIKQLKVSMNFYRWMHHFNFDKYVVVNIPSEHLRYYTNDNVAMEMKVVVGKPNTKTPRMSTYCRQVTLYPYWYVPGSIARKELIPKFRKNPGAMEQMNIQVVDKGDRIVNTPDWNDVDPANFPYIFRQGSGCDNSLGVIKFELSDPFDVYMHDTNFKLAFEKQVRALSHGCIRLEKPLELANILLNNKIDEDFVKACIRDQKPQVHKLDKPLPVFVVYMPAQVRNDSVVYHRDTYNLL